MEVRVIDLIVGLIATERRERRMEGGPLAPQDLQVLGMSQQRLPPHLRQSGRFLDRLLQDNLSRRREILLTTIDLFKGSFPKKKTEEKMKTVLKEGGCMT